jgi:hypothetical protein
MSYGYFYLSLGLVISVWMFFENKWHQKENDETLKKILRSKVVQERRIHEVMMSEVIAPLLFFAVGSFVWPGLLYLKLKEHGGIFRRGKTGWPDEPVFELKRENLLEKLSAQEIEEREVVRDPLGAVPVLPFGHLNHAWKKFLGATSSECELWGFSAVWNPWGRPELRKGYVEVNSSGIGSYFMTVCREVERPVEAKAKPKKWWRSTS